MRTKGKERASGTARESAPWCPCSAYKDEAAAQGRPTGPKPHSQWAARQVWGPGLPAARPLESSPQCFVVRLGPPLPLSSRAISPFGERPCGAGPCQRGNNASHSWVQPAWPGKHGHIHGLQSQHKASGAARSPRVKEHTEARAGAHWPEGARATDAATSLAW